MTNLYSGTDSSSGGPPSSLGARSALVISLDFELRWGVRDRRPLDSNERQRLLSARRVIPRLLEIFDEFEIHATWATVGFLFARSKDELLMFMPASRPNYSRRELDPYSEPVGGNEDEDPFHFAPSLVAEIAGHRGQEVGGHSFSHYYCLEEGQTPESFEADLQSSLGIATKSGYEIRAFVFPRNQVEASYLPMLDRAGITCFRGPDPSCVSQAANFRAQRHVHNRFMRLVDSYYDLFGPRAHAWPAGDGLVDVPASRYLAPYRHWLAGAEGARRTRIVDAMRRAAAAGKIFHLWWHPEDFAFEPEMNLAFLRSILGSFDRLRTEYGMQSLSMNEAAAMCSTRPRSSSEVQSR